MIKQLFISAASLLAFAPLTSCGPPSDEDYANALGHRVEIYFNSPGTRLDNMWESDAVQHMIDVIDSTRTTLDFAVMGFTRQEVVDAVIRAYDRGVNVRFVGDADHRTNNGYEALRERHIPMAIGNSAHIMHDKFFVSDSRIVSFGTANWTDTDLRHNSNNFIFVDSPAVAADFTAEFQQMFDGAFGHTKVEIDNGRVYQLGDTEVEVWFSPNEDAMGRILELVDGAQDSLRFTIFAFTKDQVGSAFIRKNNELRAKDVAEGIDPDAVDFRDRRSVAGVICQSQLHSNGQYHEAYRLLAAGVDVRQDGNTNSKQPGDYQAGGGRLHSKTMVIDPYGDNPMVITGSFNWSSSATVSNDEFAIVMKGARVAQMYDEYFNFLWDAGTNMGEHTMGSEGLQPGDITINEVFWYGVTDPVTEEDGFDEFIELKNHTDRDIYLDMWNISNPYDFVLGFPPGSTIRAGSTFTVVDHVLEPYLDGAPQDGFSAFKPGDLVMNAFNDNRQSRMYLKDGQLELVLMDPTGERMDFAGNGGPAFAGGPSGGKIYSMERNAQAGDGRDPASWHTCSLTEGGDGVNDDYQATIIASPGQENSPE